MLHFALFFDTLLAQPESFIGHTFCYNDWISTKITNHQYTGIHEYSATVIVTWVHCVSVEWNFLLGTLCISGIELSHGYIMYQWDSFQIGK